MSKATPTPKTHAEDDTAFDDWLAAADTATLERVEAAIDLDAGCAAIFAAAVVPETVTEDDTDNGHWGHLDTALREAADSIAPWLALRSLFVLPHQLDKAITTTRTMTVVGRALLPDSMRIPWGLASDFLTDCNAHLARLKHGLLRRDLSRQEAIALHDRALADITNFRAAFQQALCTTTHPKAHQVGERLVSTAEMLVVLLRWTRDSITYIFEDSECPTTVSVL
ncbi:hypothetical protein [Streptomyces odonnellii]|uniref:hypothetical protein n=1 Tax=Streptomyces odonnellii TaxID=1417980 RepID=UPI000625FDD1|nr:hypothetical protein [Streptomyces odonnellii]